MWKTYSSIVHVLIFCNYNGALTVLYADMDIVMGVVLGDVEVCLWGNLS